MVSPIASYVAGVIGIADRVLHALGGMRAHSGHSRLGCRCERCRRRARGHGCRGSCRGQGGTHSSLKASMGSPVSVLASYCSMREQSSRWRRATACDSMLACHCSPRAGPARAVASAALYGPASPAARQRWLARRRPRPTPRALCTRRTRSAAGRRRARRMALEQTSGCCCPTEADRLRLGGQRRPGSSR